MSIEYTAAAFSDDLADVAARVRASVVQVRAGRGGMGSGVIWRLGETDERGEAEATVITNAHVVRAAGRESFTLRFGDGHEAPATLVAVDPEHDLASLRIRTVGVQVAAIGDSGALRVGELVVAVGNPFGREGAVTVGVVAARAPADEDIALEPAEEATPENGKPEQSPEAEPREGPRFGGGRWGLRGVDLIQADIALFPGNSGGPLADARGRVVGINAMIGGGLAFAIPSRTVQHFLSEVAEATRRLYLGVTVVTAPLSPALRQRLALQQESAALVAGVEAGGPADAAGVLLGDVLLGVDGRAVLTAEQLGRALNRSTGDSSRTLQLLRGGERLDLTLTPEVRAAA